MGKARTGQPWRPGTARADAHMAEARLNRWHAGLRGYFRTANTLGGRLSTCTPLLVEAPHTGSALLRRALGSSVGLRKHRRASARQ
ncbi:hypothetical protein GCM10018779_31400 [Streptomyces griseocarneus]|nr:hypothetical protein GCM10018779_31400 [Streptomyces griseocarneus]